VTPLSLGIFASANTTVAVGDFQSIATVTVGSGGSSSISFTSIPSTYTHLQVRGIARTNRATNFDYFKITANSETSGYSNHDLYGDGASAGVYGAGNQLRFEPSLIPGANQTASAFNGFVMDILDYANTNKYKTFRFFGGTDTNGAGRVGLHSSYFAYTSAISSITINPGEGSAFSQYSHFALYGIKVAA
jgi:hypothetical protein